MKELLQAEEFKTGCTPDKPMFCFKSEPGEGSERSCAFDGARVVLMPITDAVHLIHGPIACAGNSWDNRGARSSGSQLYRKGFTTDITENDVIFGGEEKLYQAILELASKYKPAAIFVYATCVTAMIGDDLEKVCARAATKTDLPVIPVETPGFLGDKNIGNRLAGEKLLKYVIGTSEPGHTTPYDINLIGEYNIAGDLWGVLPILEKLGIRVLSCISGNARFQDITYAHRAKLNVIVCSKSLVNLAKKMQKKYGIPYMEASFYGIADTNAALRGIAEKLGDNGLTAKVEKLIAEEEAATRQKIEPYRKRLQGKSVVLFTGGVKTWSMVNALSELGMRILAGGTQNSTLEDFRRMKKLMSEDAAIIADTSSAGLLDVMYSKLPDAIVAGGKTKYLALKTKRPFLDINHGRSHPYAGYAGMVTFAKQLDLTVNSPIWKQLNAPAPWEKTFKQSDDSAGSPIPAKNNSTDNRIKKAASVNPQKNSPALGATLAFMGIDGMLALLHGSQGCSTFIRLQMSRHFKEPIPLNCTSMSQDTTIFGGWENVKKGLERVARKFNPAVIGLMTSGLTETMGDDIGAALTEFRKASPEFSHIPVIHASTPDYCGSMQEGYARAVESILRTIPEGGSMIRQQINLLPGSFLTPADIEELKEIVRAFGLTPITVPDIAGALDGHIDKEITSLADGGIPLSKLALAGRSFATISIGKSMNKAGDALTEKFGIPAHNLGHITGLPATDAFLKLLSDQSGNPIPAKYRRHRAQLLDALADNHYGVGNKKLSIALESDHLFTLVNFFAEIGCRISTAILATHEQLDSRLPAESIKVGDLEDLEHAGKGCDLLIANSNGRQTSGKLRVPLLRAGLPVFDQAGATHRVWVGYKGAMNLLFEAANLMTGT